MTFGAHSSFRRGMRITAWLFVVSLAVSACGGMPAYREGNNLLAQGKTDAGLAKLEEALRIEPNNPEFRIGLATRRASIINRMIAVAEAARREGRLTDAEKAYRQILVYEPDHPMAQQGLQALVVERQQQLAVAEAETLFKAGTPASLAEAGEKLRGVLSVSPGQREALNLKARIDELKAKEPRPETRLAAAYRKPITLEFRDTPLKTVFDVVSRVSGLNFYFDRDIRPDLKATILAKNTSIEDVVRLLLATNQLEQKVLSDNAVLVYPNTPQKLKDYQTLSVRTFYLTNADVKAVSNTIKTILKTKDMVIDERLGLIIIRDTPEAIRMAERIVTLQDLSDPEVMLEVEVLEIKRSRLLELGIAWPSQLSLSPLQTAGTPLLLSDLHHLNRDTVQATIGSLTINARAEDQDSNILANPRIRVRNKEKAKVLIGDRVPVISTTSTATGFVSESVTYVDVGLKLEVEPNIYLDDEVAIKVNLEVSSLVREIVSKSGSLSYQIGTRGANTVLRLKDGETQILAGLINDEDRSAGNRVPGLGRLPVVGRLFGSQKDDTQRSEILLSITPRIVRAIRRPDLLAAEFDSGTEAVIGAESLRLSKVEAPAPADTAASAPAVPQRPAAPAGETPAPPVPAAAGTASSTLLWQAPPQVKSGEQFSAVLRLSSQEPLRGLSALVSYDTQALQVVNVQEGDFFRQAKGSSNFSQRVDPGQGKIFVAAVRQSASASDLGVNGSGTLMTVSFKALKPLAGTRIQLTSASPEPSSGGLMRLPIEQAIVIAP